MWQRNVSQIFRKVCDEERIKIRNLESKKLRNRKNAWEITKQNISDRINALQTNNSTKKLKFLST